MIKKTLGILFKLFLICFFSIVVFYTGLSFFGLWTIARLAHEENTRSEAEKKYIAANTPPKPVEIKIEGCPSGSWNTKLYGYAEVLDTRIEVPCSLSNGKHYLVGRQFFFQLSESVAIAEHTPLIFSVLYSATNKTLSPEDFINTPDVPPRGSFIEVELPKNRAGAQRTFFECVNNACRAQFVVAPNVSATIFVHDQRIITRADLVAGVTRVFSRIQ